jgi:putative intracellular protease/amidase
MAASKILILVTNVDHYAKSRKPTGLWLSELVHFYDLLSSQGYKMIFASPKGGACPIDPRSLKFYALDAACKRRLADRKFMEQLGNTAPVTQLDPGDYDAVYFTGGHGVMWDFIKNNSIQKLTSQMYKNGRIVAAVCHGYCALINVKQPNGSYLVAEKRLTGYSWAEEVLAGVSGRIPYNAEKAVIERGAHYKKAWIPFMPFAIEDGNLVTGQNPFSTKKVARSVLNKLKKQPH